MMLKKGFDFFFSFLLILVGFFFLLLVWLVASIDTKSNGLFLQKRVGKKGKLFTIIKFRTINKKTGQISSIGKMFRKKKIDELPQLLNVLKGDMSLVGPRPDISGYADKLEGENRLILKLRPGITSKASIKYANEEEILASQNNPKKYNDEVIFPDKTKINLDYYYNHTILGDLKIIINTVFRKKKI